MESIRSPNLPRPRPGGPRTQARRQTSQPFALSPTPSEGGSPRHAGHDSPAPSSATGSLPSPGAPNFDHVPLPPPLRDAREWCEQGVQTGPPPEPSRPVSRASSAPAVKVIAKPPTLTPPPALNFEPVPVQWRGMTLESAQWTLSSSELQEIVSRAIRRTAQESFIRLLPIKTLDEELGAELERLDTAKATAQSRYRFNMHRRTMLLQSLVALSCGEPDSAALVNLVTQLADITAACDGIVMELLRLVDQRAQIQCMQEVHISSALAMALRKLNASYGKRTDELRAAKQEVANMKAELEEAWKVAQDMAAEMDDLDNFHSGFSSGSDSDLDVGDDDTRIEESVRLAEVIGVTGKAVATKATLTQLATVREKEHERPDFENRSQRVSAARKRSTRISKTSLRLPKALRSATPGADTASISSRGSRTRTKSIRQRSGAEPGPSSFKPPVPVLQVDTTSKALPSKGGSFLEMAETRPVTPATPLPPHSPPPPMPAVENHAPSQNASQSDEAHDRRATFDFIIPPITISPAEGGGEGEARGVRRVLSMQPSPRARSSEPGDGLRRASTEYKRFDGWPFQEPTPKNARRRSMPLTGLGHANHSDEAFAPPPRVFSPPPSYSAHAPGPSHLPASEMAPPPPP